MIPARQPALTRSLARSLALSLALCLSACLATSLSARAGAPPAPPDLSGHWLLQLRMATEAIVPVIGSIRTATVSTLALHLTPAPGGWLATPALCTSRIEGGTALARTVLPDALLASLRPKPWLATLQPAPDGGWRFLADPGPDDIGWDPAAGPLPLLPGDPAARDTDSDGHPGATVFVEVIGITAGQVYVAQRAHARLDGQFIPGAGSAPRAGAGTGADTDAISGRALLVELRQNILGATSPLLQKPLKILPDPENSTFSIQRSAPGCPAAGRAGD